MIFSRVLGAAAVALLALFFIPSAAFSADYPVGGEGTVVVTPPGPNGATTVVVTGGDGDTEACVVVKDSSGQTVFQDCKPLGTDGTAPFSFSACDDGTYTITATDQDGNAIGTSQVTGTGTCAQGGPSSTSAGTTTGGALPNTGADMAMTVGLIGGLALLVGGAGFLVISRRRGLAS